MFKLTYLKKLIVVQKRTFSQHHHSKQSIVIFGDSNTWGFNPDVCNRQISRFAYGQRWTTHVDEQLHHKYNIIVEGLNARTTVFDDVSSPCDGEYDCNGRKFLTTILHTHKPLKLVVIALGTNDLKSKFHASAYDVVAGVRTLIRDVRKATDIGEPYTVSTNGHVEVDTSKCDLKKQHIFYHPPQILVLGPPVIHHTHMNRIWGFDEGVESKSRKVSALLSLSAKELDIGFINLGHVAKVSPTDGVHFPLSEQVAVGHAVAHKIASMLEQKL